MSGGALRCFGSAALLLLLWGCDPRSAAEPGAASDCTVTQVSDGDSLRCGAERVRLLSIDAPELDQAPWGDSARVALQRLATGGTPLRVEEDVEARDRYGRRLAYLWLADGRMVNEELARAGYVVDLVYPPNERYAERVRAAVAEARRAGRGLWATSAFHCRPVDFRAGRCT